MRPLFLSPALALAVLVAVPACGDDDTSAPADAAPPNLYMRLGAESGIRTVITDFVGRVVADPKINGYFLNSSVDGTRLIGCLVRQVGNATGGPQTYPDPAGTPNGCRDMVAAHKGMKISAQDFDDLVGHLVASLQKAGVASADIDTIAGVLLPLEPDIVEDPNNDATVYQRVGRKPAIQAVIDGFITRVVGDARINGFFGSTDAARLKTCLVRQVCSIDGPCAYGKEVDGEPGVSKTAVCQPMATVHAGLRDSASSPITIEDFNALVGDLVMVLDGAGVKTADKEAILGALGPMCKDIVASGTGCAP